jgi:hypothetical protein
MREKNLNLKDLPLPLFKTFSISDETLEKYRKERSKILAYFEDKDFVSTTLYLLKQD